jgi:hypothetical protein
VFAKCESMVGSKIGVVKKTGLCRESKKNIKEKIISFYVDVNRSDTIE